MAGRLRQSLKAPAAAGWQLTAPCGRVSLEGKAECCASVSPPLLPGSYSLFSNPGTSLTVRSHLKVCIPTLFPALPVPLL